MGGRGALVAAARCHLSSCSACSWVFSLPPCCCHCFVLALSETLTPPDLTVSFPSPPAHLHTAGGHQQRGAV
jgi:hypothetical protein